MNHRSTNESNEGRFYMYVDDLKTKTEFLVQEIFKIQRNYYKNSQKIGN